MDFFERAQKRIEGWTPDMIKAWEMACREVPEETITPMITREGAVYCDGVATTDPITVDARGVAWFRGMPAAIEEPIPGGYRWHEEYNPDTIDEAREAAYNDSYAFVRAHKWDSYYAELAQRAALYATAEPAQPTKAEKLQAENDAAAAMRALSNNHK